MDTPAPITKLVTAFPCSTIIGCSSAGEILGDGVADRTLVVAVARFERTTLASAATSIATMSDSEAAGAGLGAELARHRPQLVFVLSDGLSVNGSDLVKGLSESLPHGTVITGGLAADGDRFNRTWVLVGGAPASGFVTAVALSGPLEVGAGSQGGWDAFGPERRVTRAKGNVLYELDGKPALALYKEYLGELASGLPATALHFPLAIRERSDAGAPVVRTILAVDETAQSRRKRRRRSNCCLPDRNRSGSTRTARFRPTVPRTVNCTTRR